MKEIYNYEKAIKTDIIAYLVVYSLKNGRLTVDGGDTLTGRGRIATCIKNIVADRYRIVGGKSKACAGDIHLADSYLEGNIDLLWQAIDNSDCPSVTIDKMISSEASGLFADSLIRLYLLDKCIWDVAEKINSLR